MEFELRQDVEDFISVISEFETGRNRQLRKKISFLRKYFGVWHDEPSNHLIQSNNPNRFFLTKEKLNA